MKKNLSIFWVFLAVLFLNGCSAMLPGGADLIFNATASELAAQEFEIEFEIQNQSLWAYRGDEDFGGVMEIREKENLVRACSEIFQMGKIESGASESPLTWKGKLTPGQYQLTWGAKNQGYVLIEFDVVEGEFGPEYVEKSRQNFSGGELPECPN